MYSSIVSLNFHLGALKHISYSAAKYWRRNIKALPLSPTSAQCEVPLGYVGTPTLRRLSPSPSLVPTGLVLRRPHAANGMDRG